MELNTFCSYEVAKLLKKLGYNWDDKTYWVLKNNIDYAYRSCINPKNKDKIITNSYKNVIHPEELIIAPTNLSIQFWLEEVRGIKYNLESKSELEFLSFLENLLKNE